MWWHRIKRVYDRKVALRGHNNAFIQICNECTQLSCFKSLVAYALNILNCAPFERVGFDRKIVSKIPMSATQNIIKALIFAWIWSSRCHNSIVYNRFANWTKSLKYFFEIIIKQNKKQTKQKHKKETHQNTHLTKQSGWKKKPHHMFSWACFINEKKNRGELRCDLQAFCNEKRKTNKQNTHTSSITCDD